MYKKLVTLLTLALSIFAANPCDAILDGYIGVVGDVGSLSGNYKGLNRIVNDKHSATIGGTSGLVGGTVGLQSYILDVFFAVQANALYNSYDKTVRSSTTMTGILNYVVNLKNNFMWGADVRVGYRIFCTTAYVLGGFESANWRLRLNNDSSSSVRGIPALSMVRTDRTLWGPKVGVGIMFPLICSLYANMEYSYIWFNRMNKSLVDSITGFEWNHKESARLHSFTLGLNYVF